MTNPAPRQFLVPVQQPFGRTRLGTTALDPTAIDPHEMALLEAESARIAGVAVRRNFRDGHQYDDINRLRAEAERVATWDRLPEHLRLHAYSTQIGEALRFLSDRVASGWQMTANSSQVQEVIDRMVGATDELAAEDDEGQQVMTVDEPLLDAMTAGDVAVYVGYDPVGPDGNGTAYLEFWDSEFVRIVPRTVTEWDAVILTQVVYRPDPASPVGGTREVTERRRYTMRTNPLGQREAHLSVTWDGVDGEQAGTRWLGIGALPWKLLRVGKDGLRTARGASLISEQAMQTAARYDAVEQVAWLIARYNSHSKLVVIGDAASAKVSKQGGIDGDIADLVTFPDEHSKAFALSLPTDPQMIEHQREVLTDALFAKFGLTRTDPESLSGLGAVTGYALEILNEKSAASLRRIVRLWRRDWGSLLNLVLDIVAWSRAPFALYDPVTNTTRALPTPAIVPPAADTGEADVLTLVPPNARPQEPGELLIRQWWDVTPSNVFPDRTVRIEMGTGYVVDDTMDREDYTTGLRSQRDVLRGRGLSEEDITRIQTEQAQERAARSATSAVETDGDPAVEGGTVTQLPAGGGPASGPGSTIGSARTGT